MRIKKDLKALEQVKNMVLKNQLYNIKDLIKSSYNEYLNLLDNDILKHGNLKLQKNIARFSLPEVVTCSCSCKGCYAKKQLFMNVRKSRLKNLFLILHALNDDNFKKLLLNKFNIELQTHAYKCSLQKQKAIMRWHDAGDIFNEQYFNFILEVAKNNQNINFYTYTKHFNIYLKYLELKKENKIPCNFNIVSSFIFNHVNYFNLMQDYDHEIKQLKNVIDRAKKENIKLFFCNYAFDKLKNKIGIENFNKFLKLLDDNKNTIKYYKNDMPCGKCSRCCNYDHVLFIKH